MTDDKKIWVESDNNFAKKCCKYCGVSWPCNCDTFLHGQSLCHVDIGILSSGNIHHYSVQFGILLKEYFCSLFSNDLTYSDIDIEWLSGYGQKDMMQWKNSDF